MQDFFSAMAESWNKLKTSNVFWSFIVGSNRNRSALAANLTINNSVFVALHARDLILLTTDLQTVNYYSTIHY